MAVFFQCNILNVFIKIKLLLKNVEYCAINKLNPAIYIYIYIYICVCVCVCVCVCAHHVHVKLKLCLNFCHFKQTFMMFDILHFHR